MALHNELIVLVDEKNNQTGTMEKIEAHQKGLLHRAFSVLLFNDKKEWLLQQRALDKYHCGGLWTNTCCSHPFPGENILHAAKRRLKEEMGIECKLDKTFDFIYRASFENGLTEYEFDHVFIGQFSDTPNINTQEVADWKYISLSDIKEDLQLHPDKYTPWFKIIIDKISVDTTS